MLSANNYPDSCCVIAKQLLPSSLSSLLNTSLIAALFILSCSCLQEFRLNVFVITTSRPKPRASAPEVHRLSKILGARKVTRSMFHTEDPRNIRCHSRNLVAQASWHLEFMCPCYLLYRKAINTQLHGDQLIGSGVPKYKQLVVSVSCKNENEFLFWLCVCVCVCVCVFISASSLTHQQSLSPRAANTMMHCKHSTWVKATFWLSARSCITLL